MFILSNFPFFFSGSIVTTIFLLMFVFSLIFIIIRR